MDRIVVFLNGARGHKVLNALIRNGHKVVAAVTPVSHQISGFEEIIKHSGISHISCDDANAPNAVENLAKYKPRLFIIGGFSTIFRAQLLSLPQLGSINLHAGRLPEYRGGSPLNWQIINGEKTAGVSVLYVDQGIDTGPILANAEIPIGDTDTIADLHSRANVIFPELVVQVLEGLDRGTLEPRPQDESHAQYWHQRRDVDGRLDFRTCSAQAAQRQIRALTRPYPGAWAMCGDSRIRFFKAEIPKIPLRGSPGRVCFLQGAGPFVVCRDHAIKLTEYEIEDDPAGRLHQGQFLC